MAAVKDTLEKKTLQEWIVVKFGRVFYLVVNDPYKTKPGVQRAVLFANKHILLPSKKGPDHREQKILNRAKHRAGEVTGVGSISEGLAKYELKKDKWKDKYGYKDDKNEIGQHGLNEFTNTVIDVTSNPEVQLIELAVAITTAIENKFNAIYGVPVGAYDKVNGLISVPLPNGVSAYTVRDNADVIGQPQKNVELVIVPLNKDKDDIQFAVEHLHGAH